MAEDQETVGRAQHGLGKIDDQAVWIAQYEGVRCGALYRAKRQLQCLSVRKHLHTGELCPVRGLPRANRLDESNEN
jgi:hypothetical protein